MNQESTIGFILRLQAKEQAGLELGLRERKYIEAMERVKRRGGNKER